MFACFACCPSTKGLIKDITTHIRVFRRRKTQQRAEQEEPPEANGQGAVEVEEDEEEWVAEPETGVLLTLLPLPSGRNHIKKIRFSKEVFDDWGAQKWWSENYDKIMELYNIASSTHSSPRPSSSSTDGVNQLTDSLRVDQDEEISNSDDALGTSNLAEETTGAAAAVGESAAGNVLEWVVEDEAGVFVTVRSTADGSKEILRVEISRERFGDVKARVWWEENKARVLTQYAS